MTNISLGDKIKLLYVSYFRPSKQSCRILFRTRSATSLLCLLSTRASVLITSQAKSNLKVFDDIRWTNSETVVEQTREESR